MSNGQIPPPPKKKMSSTMFWFLIFGGFFMTFMVLCCSGAGLLAYRASVNAKKLASAQVKWKLPKDQLLPDELRKELELAGAVAHAPNRPIKLFQDWAEKHEGMLAIDVPRFVKAMEHTGISSDINWASSWLIAQTLSTTEFNLPYINASTRVLSADWILEDQEARILVATSHSTFEAGAMHAIWVVRDGDQWRVFDWKDVLEPLTNAEYMAVYYEESPQHDGKMSELMTEISAIFESGKSDETKANAIWQMASKASIASEYREYANFQACQYILSLNQMDKLEQALRELPERSNLGRKFLKLRIAMHKIVQGTISSEDLFSQARQFVSESGWYPGLGRTLIEHAKTEADSVFAKSLLIKDLVLREAIYYGNYQHFQSEQDAGLIWEHIRQFPNAASKLAQLANAGLNNRVLESLSELSAQDERTRAASTYLSSIRAIRSEQWDKALPDLEMLFRKELLGNSVENQLKSYYAQAMLRTGQLKECMASADDDEVVLEIARDHLLDQAEPYEDWVVPSIALVLQVAAEHPEFDKQTKTIVLKAISESTHGNWNACLEPLLKCHHDITSNEGNKDSMHWKVLSLLADSLEQTQSWAEHRDEIDSAEFVLLAFGKKHAIVTFDQEQDRVRMDRWKEMLTWYRKETSIADNLWTSYFEAKLAYENGNWEDADNWMVKAIAFAKDVKQLETVYGDVGANQFMPFEYTGELVELRIEMAFRSKRSGEWLSKMTNSKSIDEQTENDESDELDDSPKFLHYNISSVAEQTMELDERDQLIAAMSESKLFEEDALDWMRMEIAKDRWDTDKMWEIASSYTKTVKDDLYGRTSWGTECILAALASLDKSKSRIDEAEKILGKEWKPELDMARYIVTLDESKRPSKEPRFQLWNNPTVRNWITERKLFQNEESIIKSAFSPPIPVTGKLLLNRTSSEFDEKQLASGLASILRENETQLRIQEESTNGGVSHWRILRDDGIILISLFDPPNKASSTSAESYEPSGASFTNFQSALAIAVIPYSQMHDGSTLLTRIAKGLSRSIDSSFGYCDEQSSSLLIGDGWREKLAASESIAFDQGRPGRCSVDVMQNSIDRFRSTYDPIEIGSEMKIELHWAHFTESMPVSIVASDSANSYSTYVVKFLNHSIIDPRLERGWMTKVYWNSLR